MYVYYNVKHNIHLVELVFFIVNGLFINITNMYNS